MAGGRGTGKSDSWDLRGTEPLIYLNLTGETSADPAPRGKPHADDLDGGGWREEAGSKTAFLTLSGPCPATGQG